jgi:hypothetical protein
MPPDPRNAAAPGVESEGDKRCSVKAAGADPSVPADHSRVHEATRAEILRQRRADRQDDRQWAAQLREIAQTDPAEERRRQQIRMDLRGAAEAAERLDKWTPAEIGWAIDTSVAHVRDGLRAMLARVGNTPADPAAPVTTQAVTDEVAHVYLDTDVIERARRDGFELLALCGARRLPMPAEVVPTMPTCEPCYRLRRIVKAARRDGDRDLIAVVELEVFTGRLDPAELFERLGFEWVGTTSTATTHAVAASGLSVCGQWLRRTMWASARPTCRLCWRRERGAL